MSAYAAPPRKARAPSGRSDLAARRRIDRQVAVCRQAKVVHHRQWRAIAKPSLEPDIEDISVEHDGVEQRRRQPMPRRTERRVALSINGV